MDAPEFHFASVPKHDKHKRYNQSDKGRARRKVYNRSEKGHSQQTEYETKRIEENYLSRRIIAWDGEGITDENGNHLYVMLANSEGDAIVDSMGLPSGRIFQFLLETAAKYPNSIHVIYGGGYDANMFIADFDREDVEGIYSNEYWKVGSYRLQWRRGKSFFIQQGHLRMTLYDVMPFFQCPFVKACDDYLGSEFEDREMIVKNKALRGTFLESDIPEVRRYNDAELRNLVKLVTELRDRLNKVGLRVSRWDGPGAIASSLLRKKGVKDAIKRPKKEIQIAAAKAYAGGRFEVIRCGNVGFPAYEYDINSAYPSAFRFLPNLSNGSWQYSKRPNGIRSEFGMYHVIVRSTNSAFLPAPLFRRHKNATISYPQYVEGWYWTPEIQTMLAYISKQGGSFDILESWDFIPNNESEKPFAWVDDLYAQRQQLKDAGDGAHVGIKLGLNSLYGKTCQQIGARFDGVKWHIPPYHCLEWGGYVTSHCRATVLNAVMDNLDSVIAFETDAVFTSEPLPNLTIGRGLGEWEKTEFESLIYCQSGLYVGSRDAKDIVKSRGIDRGSVTRVEIESAMEKKRSERYVTASLTRFVGAGLALHTDYSEWRHWTTRPKLLTVEPASGKRMHIDCPQCKNGMLVKDVWHNTFCPFNKIEEPNYEYPVLWMHRNPTIEMLRSFASEERAERWD